MEKVSIITQLKKKKPSDLHGSIMIRGFYNRKPVASKSLGYRILASHWDNNLRQVVPQAANASLINACIAMKVQEMQRKLLQTEISGHSVNGAAVAKVVKGLDSNRDFIAFAMERIRADYTSKETIRSYDAECTKLERFKSTISFTDIDYLFLTNYKRHMLQTLGNDPNTVWKSFKFLNTMINKALKIGGIIHENIFEAFDRGKYVQKQRTYLELSDCDLIESVAVNEDYPVIIRRTAMYFLMMAYAGMRYQDAMSFDPSVHVVDGCIVMDYQKCDTNVNNYMWDRLKVIIELVKDNRLKLPNQKFNEHLATVQLLAGVKKKITAHIGRHTLGGFLAEMEVPRETARAILGQKDIKSTDIYYHQKGKVIHRGMESLNQLEGMKKPR